MGQDDWIKEWVKNEIKQNPNFVEDMEAGRYTPRCEGQRIHYWGKDKWLGIWMGFLNFIFNPIMIWIILLFLLLILL
jgi:hypothetical protein